MTHHNPCLSVFLIIAVVNVLLCGRTAGSYCQRAVFDMSGIKGHVMFQQSQSSNTTIRVNLTGVMESFIWQIHEYPIVYRGDATHSCQSRYSGAVFDPTNKMTQPNYNTQCNASTPDASNDACVVGDLSGRHGYLDTNTSTYRDPLLSLSGTSSIFSRSLVLYKQDVAEPFACALVDSCDDVMTARATFRDASSGITGTVLLRQSSSDQDTTSLDINLFYSSNKTNSYDQYSMSLSDTQLSEEGIPSYSTIDCPSTSRNEPSAVAVKVPLSSNGPSTQRQLLNLQHFSLSGSGSVVGKTLVLSKDGSPVVCASIYKVLPLEGEAEFNVDGVTGTLHFKQDSELSPTVVTVDMKGLRSLANKYHIHVYRVSDEAISQQTNKQSMCSNNLVAGHWNPYEVTTSPAQGTVDQYEIGDMSGKYGNIGSQDTFSLVYIDYNMPLFGVNTVLFRSVVFHYNNGSRWVCSNVNPKTPTFNVQAKATFNDTEYIGQITVEQASFIGKYSFSHVTTFFVNLAYTDKSHAITDNHNWHIHQYHVSGDQSAATQRCVSTKGHYNPYSVDAMNAYSSTCGPMNLLRCELGDSSNKLGQFSIDGRKHRFTETENYFAGLNSVYGRSVVVHAKDSGGARITCASLKPDSDNFVHKELKFRTSTTTTSDNVKKDVAAALQVNKWRVVNVELTKVEECQKATFTLISGSQSDLDTAYENLRKNWPNSLKNYKPTTDCSLATNVRATAFTLLMLLTLTVYFI